MLLMYVPLLTVISKVTLLSSNEVNSVLSTLIVLVGISTSSAFLAYLYSLLPLTLTAE